jgi:hypothetical protein
MAQKPIPAVDVLNNKSYFKSLELFVVPEVWTQGLALAGNFTTYLSHAASPKFWD